MSVMKLNENRYHTGVQIYNAEIGALCYNLSNGTAIWLSWDEGPLVTFRNCYQDMFGDMGVHGPFYLYNAAATHDDSDVADIAMFYGVEDPDQMFADAVQHAGNIEEFLEYCQQEKFLPRRVKYQFSPTDIDVIRTISDIIGAPKAAEELSDYLYNLAKYD